VALEAGMGMRIGKDPVKVVQYRTCNNVGCIATVPFDDALSNSLKNTDDAAILFAGLDGKPVSVPFSFHGYKTSLSAWKGAEAKRHSWFWRLWS
jgi:invasion protein IalB